MFSTGDRRLSQGILGYPGYSSSTPRSLGMQEREYGFGTDVGPNRHNQNNAPIQATAQSFSSFNHHHRRSSPPPHIASPYYPAPANDRDTHIFRNSPSSAANTPPLPANNSSNRTTLCWGDIEPWMDEEYVKQVCALMGWDPVSIKVPHPAPDPVTGQQANNPGFCYLTFPTAAQAASVLAQINGGGNGSPVTMPNSSKPFVLNWASAVPTNTPAANAFPQNAGPAAGAVQQYPKEYSIFVGDLAPETSNSDLVAVFRNPVLGLRNDREPKFIRPFLSCKSAKIMLDPVTGVSRGYGFVRFTDEADQQRALIEMHGLYCLSRPMRISPATAKYKPPPPAPSLDLPQVQLPPQMTNGLDQPVTIALPLPSSNLTKSVSVPIAATTSNSSLSGTTNGVSSSGSGSSMGASNSTASLSSGSSSSLTSSGLGSVSSEDMMNLPNSMLAQIAQRYASGEATPPKLNGSSISQPFAQDPSIKQSFSQDGGAPRYAFSEESWKHHAQARAILGNLIGPNGEQLTSTDPYNTTVFVGGLSPLISEETLRTFFAPFGDIHYVKVPVGKHCGFVQFVRKADAERAIEKMQGFPVGGSRIRLSWGRSQYKAAQAAAQAAQAAALQSQFAAQAMPPAPNMMTQEQAIQLLQKLNLTGYLDNVPNILSDRPNVNASAFSSTASDGVYGDGKIQEAVLGTREEGSHMFGTYAPNGFQPRPEIHRTQSSFAPFSPDPNAYMSEMKHRDSFSRSEMLPHPSKAYAPGFFPPQTQDLKVNTNVASTDKTSPTATRPASATRFNNFLDSSNSFGGNRVPGRPEVTISRPPSGQTGQTSAPESQELDAMHDLNGTLASLDLDRDRPWKATPESSSSNAGSVPFKVANERTPSPKN
ncbi:putative RNA recognition motif contatinign protein [Lyophyllum shimeji]|uniref:RNA recognition motif contatinign protein n=1 Tax=Lyophyllum shimeji TaxID=47721 RepID=A0A9P3PER1_LYOSH|nr:putative RNA recognition motif contatinign protein [Lyophyllum shimeji]